VTQKRPDIIHDQVDGVISQTWLNTMLPSRQAFVRRLFSVFIREEPKRVENLKDAIQNEDIERIRYFAHSLKGAAATLGCEAVQKACLEIENAAKQNDLANAPKLLEKLELEMDRVYRAMEHLIQGME
jgi:HPt (histidine-containing phosphotransfer) domain-containing protein